MRFSIELYATILLVGRLISMAFIFLVLKRQWELFKLPIAHNIKHFRVVLFTLALVIFVGNLIPLGVDVATLLSENTGRPRTVSLIGFVYSTSAELTALVSAYLIWRLYRLAADTKTTTDFEAKALAELEADKLAKANSRK